MKEKERRGLQGTGSYVFSFGVTLEVGFNGFVLFVELGQVGHEVFDDVGVGKGVDARFVGCVCRDAACNCHHVSQRVLPSRIIVLGEETNIDKPACSPHRYS